MISLERGSASIQVQESADSRCPSPTKKEKSSAYNNVPWLGCKQAWDMARTFY